jgi:threonine dehydratase
VSLAIAERVEMAHQRIRPFVRETYLETATEFGAGVFVKLENLQHTGSFKVRGALNKILSLSDDQRQRGVVAASTGNHGRAVAYSLKVLGAPGTIFVPASVSPDKRAAIEQLGAAVIEHGDDCVETEVFARAWAHERQMTYISPYNDAEVIAGQGTIALEMLEQLGSIDVVFVALGGGGLLSGIAGYLAEASPGTRCVGCSPAHSQVMIQSIAARRILAIPSSPTLSDSTAGGIEPGAITFDLCRQLVSDYMAVSEDEIRTSLTAFLRDHSMLIEGAAAVPLAAYRMRRQQLSGQRVVIVVCGANIPPDVLRSIL